MNRIILIGLSLIIAGVIIWAVLSSRQVDDSVDRIASIGPESPALPSPSPVPSTPAPPAMEAKPGDSSVKGPAEPGSRESTSAAPMALRGLVRSETGGPVSGAELLLVAQTAVPAVVRSASSSSDGTFRIEQPPSEGQWALLAAAAGFARGGLIDLNAQAFSAPVEIVLSPEAPISGRIMENVTGKLIPEATVGVRLEPSAPPLEQIWCRIRPRVAACDAGGGYRLIGLAPETRWDLVCAGPAHLPRERLDVPSGSGGIDFVLDRGCTVHGTVLAENTGEGVPGARVRLWSDESTVVRRDAVASDGGGFLIQGLPAGEYRLRAEWEEQSSHPRPEQGTAVSVSGTDPEQFVILLLKEWPVGVLSGTVRDIQNAGVREALVVVMDIPDRVVRFRAETDNWGKYRVEGIFGGDYRVVPRAEGLYTDERGLRMQDGEVREGFDFVMVPGFTISGRVTLADEKTGVGGTSVGMQRQRWGSFPDAVSEPDGTYVFGPVPAGDHVLRARPPEEYVAREGVRQVAVTDSPVTGVDFIVEQGGSITGTVVSATGPVEGAAVSLATALETPERIPTYPGTAQTDLEGRYALLGVPEGLSYSIVVQAAGYAGHVSAIETMRSAEPVEHPTIRLDTPGATIFGSARMANGSTPGPFGVSARMSDWEDLYRRGGRWQPSTVERGTRVGSDGAFTLAGLEAGTWQVSLRVPPFMNVEPQTVDLPPNGEATVDFVIGATSEGTAVISGHVRFAGGSPAVGYQVQASAFRQREFMSTTTDGEGYFRFEGLTDGREYRLESRAPDTSFWSFGTGPTTTVTAPAEGVELIIEAGGTLTGRVTDLDGKLVSNYAIQLDQERGRRFRGGPRTLGTIETMPGVYVVRDLPPGRYRVVGYAPERAPAETDWVDVEPARITDGADLVFDPGATLRGRVLEEGTEEPVAGTRVSTGSRGWNREMTEDFVERSDYTDADGRFVLEHVPRGSIWLVAHHGLYAAEFQRDVEIPNEGDPEEVTIYLTLGGSIEGKVLDITGLGVPGQEVGIRRRRGWDGSVAVTDSGGRFQTNRLRPGDYSVEWRSYRQRVQVETGETASVVIQEATEAPQEPPGP